jgi:hypothetical protein
MFLTSLIGFSVTMSSCQSFINSPASSSGGLTAANLDVTSIGSTSSTAVTFSAPSGTGYSSVTVDLSANFTAANICTGATIFGKAGTSPCLSSIYQVAESGAFRNANSTQISQNAEVVTYADQTLPVNYRDIPDSTQDIGTLSAAAMPAATHAAMVNCGEPITMAADNITGENNPSIITQRIAHCADAARNGANATWYGSSANGGESNWKLVSRIGANQEVWQDQRTLLLWTSPLGITGWCTATGNAQATDPACSSTTYQTYYPVAESYCAETGTIPGIASEAVAGTLGNAWSGTYSAGKGGMGANSATAKVKWRAPTMSDIYQAQVDGIRYVFNAYVNVGQYIWSATSAGVNGANAYDLAGADAQVGTVPKTAAFTLQAVCVGR